MADVRSLLKNERAARRIQHKHASYSTIGALLCTVCHLQLKSEALWDGHLRSAGHLMRVQKLQDASLPPVSNTPNSDNKKKRKASSDDEEDTTHKRTKPMNGFLPEGFFGPAAEAAPAVQPIEMQIPSRPATPAKPPENIPKMPEAPEPSVDEDQWAAFEADIAAAETAIDNDTVISAPAMTADEIKKRSAEEEYTARKERQEAEMEGDKEDAARKLEEEFEEMEGLEARVNRLREKREELRRKESVAVLRKGPTPAFAAEALDEEEDDESEEDDDWDGFRMKA